MADTKNKNTGISVWEKINKQAEYIAKNEKNTLLDIDVMLEYLRQMYDEYMTMRINIDNADKAALPKNECRMRSLFDDADFDEEGAKATAMPKAKPSEVAAVVTEVTTVAANISEPAEATKAEEEPITEEPSAMVEEVIAVEENTLPAAEEPLTESVQEEPQTTLEPCPVPEEPEEEPEEESETENEQYAIQETMPAEENIALDADDIFDFVPTENGTNTEEKGSDSFNDIDLDEIEFEEDDDDATTTVTPAVANTHTHAPAGMPPAYWGDEIDTDTPAPSKPVSIGETYRQERPSINDMLANYQKNNTIGQKLPSAGSIMGNMDMNDKFTFIRELFQNDNAKFQESINRLDSIKSLKDVIICMESMKKQYHWNENNASVLRLQELIYAKFNQN